MPQHADELSLLQAQIVYKKRLEAVMRELTAQEEALQEKAEHMKAILLREEKDVERLEKPGLPALFFLLTGQMGTVMDKERREAYAARARYDTVRRELEAIREDILETREDLQDLSSCEETYARKLEEKRKELAQVPDSCGASLLEKEQLLVSMSQQIQELEEAIAAGTSALRMMAELQQHLHTAKDWSGFGGSPAAFLVDRAREEKLQEARETVAQMQILIQRFNKELSDVDIRPKLQASVARMLQFADELYSDVQPEMTIPERISHVCFLADQTREFILGVLRQLQNALEEIRHKQARTRQEMDELVLQTVNE